MSSEQNKKIKVLTLSDMPLGFSGVGLQTKHVITSLLDSGKFTVRSFGGGIKHNSYKPVKVEEYGDDWVVWPVDGHGDAAKVRGILKGEKPDIVWIMTDPRFWGWLWSIDNEIRSQVPLVYYHLWDNYPVPYFNKKFYESSDVIVAVTRLAEELVKIVSPQTELHRIPHAVDPDIFKRHKRDAVIDFGKRMLGPDFDPEEKMTFLWDNRNARRKQVSTLLYWFKSFLEQEGVGKDAARLIMHTNPKDEYGTDIDRCLRDWNLINGEVVISAGKMETQHMGFLYNLADCGINISDAEGFGLNCLSCLSSEVPMIATKTGGLAEQITDGENTFGIALDPASKALVGSHEVPYIREDRLSEEQFVEALTKMYSLWKNDRETLRGMGQAGRQHVLNNFSYEGTKNQWVDLMEDIHKRHGSWETRKGYSSWSLDTIG